MSMSAGACASSSVSSAADHCMSLNSADGLNLSVGGVSSEPDRGACSVSSGIFTACAHVVADGKI